VARLIETAKKCNLSKSKAESRDGFLREGPVHGRAKEENAFRQKKTVKK